MESQDSSLDIISSLPPSIIETILCLVPIQDAARTSVLSKDWRYKWTKIPKLVFAIYPYDIPNKVSIDEIPPPSLEESFSIITERTEMSRRLKLFFAIFQVLLVHQGPIHDFTLSVDADESCVEIDQIIKFLSRKNTVKKLTLELSLEYRLPLSVFSLHQLTDLSLSYCDIDYYPEVNGFGSLISLYMDHVNFHKETLLHLLSNCPLLKSITMLMVERNFCYAKFTVIQLFECLHVIERVTFLSSFLECFDQDVVPRELPTSLVYLKYLCIEEIGHLDKPVLPFLALVIRNSPNLEKIKLQYYQSWKDYYSQDKMVTLVPQDYSDIWLEQLNELEIKNFANFKHEIEFVKFILASAPLLRKVSLRLDFVVTKNEELEMLRNIARSPRASPMVEICVEHNVRKGYTYRNVPDIKSVG